MTMDMPSTPVEFMHRCLMDQLDSLPEGSVVELPVSELRNLYTHYRDSLDLINELYEQIDELLQSGRTIGRDDAALGD